MDKLGYLIEGDNTKLRRKVTFKRSDETRNRFNLGKTRLYLVKWIPDSKEETVAKGNYWITKKFP